MPDKASKVITNPRVAFQNVYDKAIALGLSPKEFKQLETLDFIKTTKTSSSSRNSLHLFVIFLALSSGVYFRDWPISRRDLFAVIAYLRNRNITTDKCMVDYHTEIVSQLFRPVENCGECFDVRHVDRVSNISQDEFERKYAYTKRPVVVEDGAMNWSAPQVFNFEYFRQIYREESRASCWFDPYKSGFKSVRDVFNMSDERAQMKPGTKPWYVGWSNCDPIAAAELRRHYQRPYFLPKVAESSKTDWIFMGSSGYGAPMHIDNVKLPSWQAQITGQKLWTLKPPLECTYHCPSLLQVTVNPGEIIVLDTNTWYHSTLIVGKDMSITIGSEFD